MEDIIKKIESSFIICTKDRYDDTVKCIETILRQTALPKELIVINAGGSQQIKYAIADLLKGSKIAFIYKESKPNVPYQRNIGIDVATGNLIFFFDDDILLDENYHQKILDLYSMDEKEEVAGATGIIKNPIQNPVLGKVFRRIFPLDGERLQLINYPGFQINDQAIKPVNHMWGCQMSFRKKVLEQYRFDEKMGEITGYAFLEDQELTSRIAKKYVLLQNTLAWVYHNVSPVGRDNVDKLQEIVVNNTHHIFKKNAPKTWKNYLIFFWQQIGIFLHALAQAFRKRNSGWIKGVLRGYWRLLFLRDR